MFLRHTIIWRKSFSRRVSLKTPLEHYSWVLSHWNIKSQLKQDEVSLKAISSRYEALKVTHWIPTELTPMALDSATSDQLSQKLPAPAREWISWIDALSMRKSGQKNSKQRNTKNTMTSDLKQTLDGFRFEANRAIYVRTSTKIAAERLTAFSLERPDSKFAVPSATLVMDSYVKSARWDEGYQLTSRFLNVNWHNPQFSEQLRKLAADFSYKIAEASFQSKNYAAALMQTKVLQEKFRKSERSVDGILLTARIYLAMDNKASAQIFFSKLIKEFPQSKERGPALLNRAMLSEEVYDFKSAVEDYKAYLAVSSGPSSQGKESKDKNTLDLSKRIYFLQWVNGSTDIDCSRQKSEEFKDDDLNEVNSECEKYQASSYLRRNPTDYVISAARLKLYLRRASAVIRNCVLSGQPYL